MSRNLRLSSVVLMFAVGARGDLLWDNNIMSNGAGGRAVSPPAFPDIRVVDDFIIEDEGGWGLESFQYGVIVDDEWIDGDITEVFIRENVGGRDPVGPELANTLVGHTRVDTGDDYFGRDYFIYSTESLDVILEPGAYWIGLRHPRATGKGTSYWARSDGGRNGPGTSDAYFSLDGGETWVDAGKGWTHAFEIQGRIVPEPSAAMLFLGGGALVLLRRSLATPKDGGAR